MGGLGSRTAKDIKRVKTRSPTFRRSEFSELSSKGGQAKTENFPTFFLNFARAVFSF